jgi:tetratricopeptide (TPR) repeat protein
MQTSRFAIPLLLGSLVSLAACSQGGSSNGSSNPAPAASAAQPAVAVTADGRKLRPLTDMEIAQDAYSKGDFPKALDHFRAAAVAGDPDAMYYTGLMYAEAQGIAKADLKEAIRWYEKAAARDQPKALGTMGRLYVTGYGVDRDPKKALEMFERAVKASPPGPEHDQAEEQRAALAGVLDSQGKNATAANAPAPAAKP